MWYRRALLFIFVLLATHAFGQRNKKVNDQVFLRNLSGINTKDSEFSPAFYGNGLVFVSRLRQGPVDAASNERYFDLFFAELMPTGQSLKPELFSLELNSPLHEGPATFDRDLNKVFFTRSNQRNGITNEDASGVVRLAIYEAERGIFDWENVRELPFNSSDYSCMHPTLSPDGKKIFFASNKPGGYGGTDLYFAEKLPNGWSPAINLGPEINTQGNEAYPFYHPSGTLFFASNKHNSRGGLDIFAIDISSNTWGKVINLEAPFNSPADDFGLILDDMGQKGYFSSNRTGGFGSDDIYSFESAEPIIGMDKPIFLETRLLVQTQDTRQPVADANIWIFETDPSGKIKDRSNYDYQLVSDNSDTLKLKLGLVRKSLKDIGAPDMVSDAFGGSMHDFSDAADYLVVVEKEGFETLEFVLSPQKGLYANPLILELKGQQCIPLRASVVAQDTRQAIPEARVVLVHKGKDEQRVLQTDTLGFFNDCLEKNANYQIRVSREGFQEKILQLQTASAAEIEPLALEFVLEPLKNGETADQSLQTGTVIVLEDIYYDFNQSSIRSGQVEELDALARLMLQYPGMQIELAAHTDTRGTAAYNLQLSEKRAEATKRYLVNKGIAAHRIQTVGYGEAFPRNHCLDGIQCSEEDHAYNRRTEIKVLDMGNGLPNNRKN